MRREDVESGKGLAGADLARTMLDDDENKQ